MAISRIVYFSSSFSSSKKKLYMVYLQALNRIINVLQLDKIGIKDWPSSKHFFVGSNFLYIAFNPFPYHYFSNGQRLASTISLKPREAESNVYTLWKVSNTRYHHLWNHTKRYRAAVHKTVLSNKPRKMITPMFIFVNWDYDIVGVVLNMCCSSW